MKWTTEKPTNPGWYWMKHESYAKKIIEISKSYNSDYLCVEDGDSFEPLSHEFYGICKWAGPIHEPED